MNISWNITVPDDFNHIGKPAEIVIICLLSLLLFSGIFVNLSIIILFLNKRPSLTPTNYLLGNLAASNCMGCFIVIPVVISNVVIPPKLQFGMMCDTFSFFRQAWWISNIYTLLFISYDKRKFITCPLMYRELMTGRKAISFIIVSWSISVILSVIPIIGWTHYIYSEQQYYCSLRWDKNLAFNISYTVLSFWIPCFFIIYCYINIVWNANGNIRRLAALVEGSTTCQRNSRSYSLCKTVKTSCLVIITFLISWLPYFVIVFCKISSDIHNNFLIFSSIIIYLPVFVYPYLFAFRNRKLRLQLCLFYSNIKIWRDVRRIHPAPTIDERDFPENVSRRNSRSESLVTEMRSSRRGSSIVFGIYRRESGMTNVEI